MKLAPFFLRSLFVAALGLASAHAASSLQASAEPGALLGGRQFSYTDANGSFSAIEYGSGVLAQFSSPTHNWTLTFSNVSGQALSVGSYERARLLATPTHPLLNVAGEGLGCGTVATGRFIVRELVRGSGGTVSSFAADFEFHCGANTRALFGGIRVNSSMSYVQMAPLPMGPTFLQLGSQPGDFLLNGQARFFTMNDGWFTALVNAAGPAFAFDAPGNNPDWHIAVGNGSGTPLAVGTYENAIDLPNSQGRPGISIGGENRACTPLTGRFVVRELTTDDDGIIVSAAIDVEGRCSGQYYGSWSAGIRFNSSVAYVAPTFLPVASQLQYVDSATRFIVAAGSMTPALRIRAQDASGSYVVGAYVRFELSSNCGYPLGYIDVVSDSFGIATLSPFQAGTTSGLCTISAVSVPALASRHDFQLDIYRPEEIALAASPASLVTQVGQPFQFQVTATVRSMPLANMPVTLSVVSRTAAGVSVLPTSATTDLFGMINIAAMANGSAGTYEIHANAGVSTLVIAVEQRAPGAAVAQVSGSSPAGGSITASLSSGIATCGFGSSTFMSLQAAAVASAPRGLVFTHGLASLRVEGCGAGQPVAIAIDYPQDVPPTAALWRFGPTLVDRSAHWYMVPVTINGHRISFTVTDGATGDDDITVNGSITLLGGIAVPGGLLQDLWWAGSAENGWGMSIVQHGDVLFPVIYAYDSAGRPTWYAMPGGTWNASHTTYTGTLYQPLGTPYFQYDASRFSAGAPVGTATLTFIDSSNASLDVTIGGVSGHKAIVRQIYGGADLSDRGIHADMWWGGAAQNGWGVAILQQYTTVFGAWFTYDAAGAPTWFVMPTGSWTSANTYEGRMYRTTSSGWLGVPYDATRLQTTDAGSFRLQFNADAATLDYVVDGRSGTLSLSRQPF
jgi:hypothetical protein